MPIPLRNSAAVEALNGPQESVAAMLAEYTARRAWLLEALGEIPRLSCNEPEGAFYVFPSVRECLDGELKTSADFATRLLTEEQRWLLMELLLGLRATCEFRMQRRWSNCGGR